VARVLGVLAARVAQRRRFGDHRVQPLAASEHVLDVLRHDLLYVREVLIELVEVALRARVHVEALGLLNEWVELDERVRARCALDLARVAQLKLLLQLLKVVEGQAFGVSAIGQREVANAAGVHVVEEGGTRLDAELRGRAHAQLPNDLLCLSLPALQFRLLVLLVLHGRGERQPIRDAREQCHLRHFFPLLHSNLFITFSSENTCTTTGFSLHVVASICHKATPQSRLLRRRSTNREDLREWRFTQCLLSSHYI